MSVMNILVRVNTERALISQEDLIAVVSWGGRVKTVWVILMNVKIRILVVTTRSASTP